MSVHRREFLRVMLAALPAVCVGGARTRAESAPTLGVVNHNDGGRAEVTEGRTLLVTIDLPSAVGRLTGSFPVEIETAAGLRFVEEQPLFFYPAGDRRTFRTILSAPLDAVAGDYQLKLTAGGGGPTIQENITYYVKTGQYRRSVLSLSDKFSEPPAQLRERLRREFETMAAVYKARTPRRWRESFIRPVSAADANNFGVRRVVNGSKRYRHAGLDYRAPLGTPVRAVNDGVVVLSTTHWTPGQLVCVDHGGGIFSRYIHLSERRVRRGETVRRGQVIALSGKSGGQKTRPHLHVDVVVNGTQVSPKGLRLTAARLLAAEAS